MNYNETISRQEARRKAKEATPSITTLIDPSDLRNQDIDSWENVDLDRLTAELGMDMVNTSEIRDYEVITHDLALSLWIDEMPRIAMEHLVYNDKETAVIEANVWPNSMSITELWEVLEENYDKCTEAYDWYYEDAHNEVYAGIIDGYLKDLEE